jgi:hypothetical protein
MDAVRREALTLHSRRSTAQNVQLAVAGFKDVDWLERCSCRRAIDHLSTAESGARYYDANELENSDLRDFLLYPRNRAWLKEKRRR